jgi:integrase
MRKLDVAALVREGVNRRINVGQSLSLYVRGKSALWLFQYRDRINKRHRTLSLGSAIGPAALSITEARARRAKAWADLLAGTALTPNRGNGKTFAEATEAFLAVRSSSWKATSNEGAAYQRLLKQAPSFAALPMSVIDAPSIRDALKPWHGTQTSIKHLARIKAVIDFAIASGWFTHANPATMAIAGKLLPKVATVEHHDAMPSADVPSFMRKLATFDVPASRALAFTILTVARTGEALGATWREIVGDQWRIPGERMKAGKDHVVPLTPAAFALLGDRGKPEALVFGKLDDRAMRPFVKDRGCRVHGFRSTFMDWANEAGHDANLVELSLAHAVGSTVTRAYARSDLLERRRGLMEAWSTFASGA